MEDPHWLYNVAYKQNLQNNANKRRDLPPEPISATLADATLTKEQLRERIKSPYLKSLAIWNE